ncbi:hypothetical protein CLIB1444_13S02520 [[Candida] jaroonii]|uniref:Uncharacterized protein n=1 Tax=[Candida] jaroonii TaxID=467808 RepID=A0ACA9YEV6_9ASCO|nr:hypothetical protein CLIB1444_13S02520 [[Candida] jaroonii]
MSKVDEEAIVPENGESIEISEELDYESDVSLDEEDEELIGRIFYGNLPQSLENDDELRITEDEEELSDITDLEDIEDEELVQKYKKLKSLKVDKNLTEEERKRLMMMNFTEDQMDRFEAYRRTTINKPGVKKICNAVLGHSIPQNISVILAGLSKSYLSEIITKAYEVQEKEFKSKLIEDIEIKKNNKRKIINGLSGQNEIEIDNIKLSYQGDYSQSLQPQHIREAIRLFKLENSGYFNDTWRAEGEADGKFFR